MDEFSLDDDGLGEAQIFTTVKTLSRNSFSPLNKLI